MTEFKEIQKLVFEEYVKNGYYAIMESVEPRSMGDIAEIGLVGTELTEIIEDVRNNDSLDKIGEECSDVIIRVLNFATRKGIVDLEPFILAKHRKNLGRPKLHGRKVL